MPRLHRRKLLINKRQSGVKQPHLQHPWALRSAHSWGPPKSLHWWHLPNDVDTQQRNLWHQRPSSQKKRPHENENLEKGSQTQWTSIKSRFAYTLTKVSGSWPQSRGSPHLGHIVRAKSSRQPILRDQLEEKENSNLPKDDGHGTYWPIQQRWGHQGDT